MAELIKALEALLRLRDKGFLLQQEMEREATLLVVEYIRNHF